MEVYGNSFEIIKCRLLPLDLPRAHVELFKITEFESILTALLTMTIKIQELLG